MSSENLGSSKNLLKGNLGGSWDILQGYQGNYVDSGIARNYGITKAAYSLRDIGAHGTRVCNIRRSSDNANADFSAIQLASGAATDFVGSGNDGFVTIWYDQSGNGIDASNNDTDEQPQIIESGTYLASLKFNADTDGSNPDFLKTTTIVGASTDFFVSYVIANKADQSSFGGVIGSRSANAKGYNIGIHPNEKPQIFIFGPSGGGEDGNDQMSVALGTSDTNLITYQRDGQEVKGFLDGTERSSYTSRPMTNPDVSDPAMLIGCGDRLDQTISAEGLKAEIKEIVFYETDRTDDRTEIEADIAKYYGL